MDKELRRKLDIDQFDLETFGRELRQPGQRRGHALKEAVKGKVTMTGSQDNRVKDCRHHAEQPHRPHNKDDDNAHQHRPQRVDVVPKRHLLQLITHWY